MQDLGLMGCLCAGACPINPCFECPCLMLLPAEASSSASYPHCLAATSHTGLMSALQRERGSGASRSWFNPEESTQQKASLESHHSLLAKQLHPLCNSYRDSQTAKPLLICARQASA